MTFTPVDACRSCGSRDLFPVIDLGEQPLANDLRPPGEVTPPDRYPLALVGCRACSLVQLTGTVDPAVLFDSYHYFSSYSTTMLEAMDALAGRLVGREHLGDRHLVVEVASNDGYLLQHYASRGVPVLGIDPARNVAEVAIARGIPTVVDYFGRSVAERLVAEGHRADVLHANNVMAHVPDVNDFAAGIAALLQPGGLAVIETPHLVRMVEGREFDTIYHEHVFYWSLTAADALLARHGLAVVDVEELSIHGGTLRLFVRRAGAAAPAPAVGEIRDLEAKVGVRDPSYYADFAGRVEDLRREVTGFLRSRRAEGARLAAYGAAAKGTVLLNHFGIGRDLLDFVVDRSQHKQGLVVPGADLPIRPPEALLEDRPDLVLLLAWNFADEIVAQQQAYVEGGGRFVLPVPELRVVPA